MHTCTLLTTALLGLTAQAVAQYSKLSADAGALAAKNSDVGNAVSAWVRYLFGASPAQFISFFELADTFQEYLAPETCLTTHDLS